MSEESEESGVTHEENRGTTMGGLLFAMDVAVVLEGLVGSETVASGRQISPAVATGGDHTIRVSGYGESSVTPHTGTGARGVKPGARDGTTAFSASARATRTTIAAIKAERIPAQRIQTIGLSTSRDDQKGDHLVMHLVTVRIAAMVAVGAMLDFVSPVVRYAVAAEGPAPPSTPAQADEINTAADVTVTYSYA